MPGTMLRMILGRALVALPLAVLATAALADCSTVDADIRAAVKAGDVARFDLLNSRMLAEPTCHGEYREKVGRALALASLKRLEAEFGSAPVLPVDGLKRAVRYGRPWQVLMALGDAEYKAENWPDAVRGYESAIDDIRDDRLNPTAPAAKIEVLLFKRAYQARALASAYVPVNKVRDKIAGIASPKFRNFTVEAVPVPIRFAYKEANLSEDGTAAAAEMLAYFTEQGTQHVRLVGHTDPVGSDGYNSGLSKARAEAIKAYLVAGGYAGTIDIVGMGEKAPFEPDDPAAYDDEQKHAFDRRVEYQLLD